MSRNEILMKRINDIKKRKILLDTNILICCGREEYGDQFRKVLRILTDNDNSLGVSLISGFEIIKKFNDKDVIGYYIKLLNFIINVVIDHEILTNAARLANTIYGPNKDNYKKDNDMIISSTVLTEQAWLLTCDRDDFNKPYWLTEARETVQWEDPKDDSVKVLNIFLLSPDIKELEKNGFRFVSHKKEKQSSV